MITEQKHRLWFLLSDFFATVIAWCAFNVVRFNTIEVSPDDPTILKYLAYPKVIIGQILVPAMMMGIYWLSGFYNRTLYKSRVEIMTTTVGSVGIGVIFVYFIALVDDPIPDRFSNYILLSIMALLLFSLVFTGRFFINELIHRRFGRGEESIRAIIIGRSNEIVDLIERQQRLYISPRHTIVGVMAIDGADHRLDQYVEIDWSDIDQKCSNLNPDKIILALKCDNATEVLAITRKLYHLNRPIQLPAWKAINLMARLHVKNIAGEQLSDINMVNISESYRNVKRVADICLSALSLAVLAPVFAIVAVLVKLDSKGPVFYRQQRVGYNGKLFTIYKFRTMISSAEEHGPALSSESDNRVTSLGRTLRKYRLDEIPQFWNVLKGDMALVGPRPERDFYLKKISEIAPQVAMIHQLKPGLTSWGMVKFGYASTVDQMVDRLAYDMIYLDNVSMLVDLKILIYTVSTVITGKGV